MRDFAVPAAIEKSPATAMCMQPFEGTETGNEQRSPLPFLTLKVFPQQEIPFTKHKVRSDTEVLVWRRQSVLVYQL